LSDYALQFGLAVVVLTVASAAVIMSRRNYIKSADFERNIEALRLEFRRSIDATHAATIKSARTISENVVSVIQPIDSNVTDLTVRLAKLEQHADATATLLARIQKQLDENERIAGQLEQNLKELTNELSFFKQTIEQDINYSRESINSRVINTQRQVDQLLPRLVLGEKARKDLGSLINLFVKRLKKVNANTTETALRLGGLESYFRSKLGQLEERHGSILERDDCSTSKTEDHLVEDTTAKAADRAVPIEANTDTENAEVFERAATPVEESSNEASGQGESRSDNGRADKHAT
jgi:predicted  nucleic acid-binding Zn-ribbon protein